MTITVESQELIRAMQAAIHGVPRVASTPALEGLRLHRRDADAITLTATDLDTWITHPAPVSHQAERGANGADQDLDVIIGNPRAIARALKAANSREIRLTPGGQDQPLALCAGPLNLALQTTPGQDHPPPPRLAGDRFTATLGRHAQDLLSQALLYASDEQTRYYLHGVFLAFSPPWTCTATATNGHILACFDVPALDAVGATPDADHPSGSGVIIPRGPLRTMLAIARRTPDLPVRMHIARIQAANSESPGQTLTGTGVHHVEFQIGDTTLTTRCIDGTFPDYARVIPKELPRGVTVTRADLVQAVHTIGPGLGNKHAAMRLTIAPDHITVEGRWDYGASRAVITIPADGNVLDLTLSLNSRYLAQVIQTLGEAEKITFAFASPCEAEQGPSLTAGQYTQPLVLASPQCQDRKIIMMPMRV